MSFLLDVFCLRLTPQKSAYFFLKSKNFPIKNGGQCCAAACSSEACYLTCQLLTIWLLFVYSLDFLWETENSNRKYSSYEHAPLFAPNIPIGKKPWSEKVN